MALVMIIVFVLAAASIAWLVRRIAFSTTHLPVTAGWIDDLSSDRYRPLLLMMNESDSQRSQAGFPRHAAMHERKRRCQILRGYLRCMNDDFGQVCLAIKLLMLNASDDRPDLATLLLRHQVAFVAGMVTAYVRLFLYRWGFYRVDVTGLIRTFDAVRVHLQTLRPVSMKVDI